jgi:thiol-disulfide isomerase/thioredoxin
MRRRLGLAVAAAVLLVGGCSSGASQPTGGGRAASFAGSGFAACPTSAAGQPKSGKLAGLTSLTCMDGSGNKTRVGAPTGRPTVLNLWASWCPPCGKEMPAFVQLSAGAGDRITVLGVDSGDSASNSVAAARDYGVRYANVFDPQELVRRALAINSLPATVFLTPSGELAYVYRGAPLTAPALTALIRQHLGVTLK